MASLARGVRQLQKHPMLPGVGCALPVWKERERPAVASRLFFELDLRGPSHRLQRHLLAFTLLAQISTQIVKINRHTILPLGSKGLQLLPHISSDITPRSESNDALEHKPGLVFPPLLQEHLPEPKVRIDIGRSKADGLMKGPDGFRPSSQPRLGDTEVMVHLREVCLIVKGLSKVFYCLS